MTVSLSVVSDGSVTIRSFEVADRAALLAGRDDEWERWLGPGSPAPSPTACIEVAGTVVGWVDADFEAPWLGPAEVNVGYNVFAAHRGRRFASRAVRLLLNELGDRAVEVALLVVDPENTASHRVARAVGARAANRTHPDHPDSVVYVVDLASSRVHGVRGQSVDT